ncbi:hypothetical protein [Enterococcus sp. N249-2]
MVVEASRSPRRKKRNGIMNFTKWKQEAVSRLLEDDELMKLLYYSTEDCLAKKDVPMEVRESLLNTQIFEYRYIDQIADKKKSYISMGLANFVPQEGFRQFSDDYIQGYFYFYILVDRGIINTATGCRTDLIAGRIYEIFQEQKVFGIGEARLESLVELWQQSNDFGGYTLGFRVVDMK